MTGADTALFLCRLAFDGAALFLFGASAYLALLVPAPLRSALWSELAAARRLATAALVLATLAALPVRTALVFAGNANPIRDVTVGGKAVVVEGRHVAEEAVARRYTRTLKELLA